MGSSGRTVERPKYKLELTAVDWQMLSTYLKYAVNKVTPLDEVGQLIQKVHRKAHLAKTIDLNNLKRRIRTKQCYED